ncbi:MAG: hypothetical protein HRT69_12020 [Flavobacteriaceae bacterium]|nr:hypothetical protein [Flavobacteriaceae bacterium]
MSKKHLNIVLLVGVVSIWGLLIYKAFGNSFTNEDEQQNYAVVINKELPVSIQKDTVKLKSYSRDPFLGNLKNRRVGISKTKKGSVIQKVRPVVTIQWPQLRYLGFVKEATAKEPLLLLKVNGKLMRKKFSFEFYEGMKILNFYRDSILVKFKEEQKTIKKG